MLYALVAKDVGLLPRKTPAQYKSCTGVLICQWFIKRVNAVIVHDVLLRATCSERAKLIQ